MIDIKKYVLGFAFYSGNVILILKARPEFQKNKINGVGGKVNEGETYRQAMVREFYEKTSSITFENQWTYVGVLNDLDRNVSEVAVFCTLLSEKQYNEAKRSLSKVIKGEISMSLNYNNKVYLDLDDKNILMYNLNDLIADCLNELGIKDNKNFIPRIYKNHEYSN